MHVFTSYLIRIASSNRRTPYVSFIAAFNAWNGANANSVAAIICSAGGAYRGQTF